MSLSAASGSSTPFHPRDNSRGMLPVMPQLDLRKEPDHLSDFRFNVPPPNIRINPHSQIKPEKFAAQSTQIRYPKSALNRSEEGLPAPWSRNVSGSSFNFAGPTGNQVCF